MTIDPRDSASSAADAIARAAAILDDIPPGDRHHPTLPPAPGVDVVTRALSVVGQGVYGLGRGGRRPLWPTPFDALGRCDCSGYALSWAFGLDRYQPGRIAGDWLACDLVYADATGPRRMWRRVDVADVQPGDALVYPGRHENGRRVAIGHCAVVVERPAVVTSFADCGVTHCHGPAGHSPAITRATGALWTRHGGIAVRRVTWEGASSGLRPTAFAP